MTFRGIPISEDEAALFETTATQVKYGNSTLANLYHRFPENPEESGVLWRDSLHEPLYSWLSMPLYGLAWHIDAIGLLHTTWLFNILITAGIGVLIYIFALQQGYRPRTGIFTALFIGTGTMLWPYSQTHFRESLLAFWLLLAYGLALAFHQNGEHGGSKKQRQAGLVVALLIVFFLAMATKVAAILAIPGLLIAVWPSMSRRTLIQGSVALAGLAILLILVLIAINPHVSSGSRLDIDSYMARFEQVDLHYIVDVWGAYLLSPGRSIFITSPILVIVFYGSWLLYQQKKGQAAWRFAFAPYGCLLGITLGYSLGGFDWHAGLGWGIRYLLPAVPVMGLLLLPVVEKLLTAPTRTAITLFLALVAFSVLIQISAVFVPIGTFYKELADTFPERPIAAYYDEGLWQIQYTPWLIHLKHLDFSQTEFAWEFASPSWPGYAASGLFILTGITGLFIRRMDRAWQAVGYAAGAFLLLVLSTGFALHSLNEDSRMMADRPALHELNASLEQQARDDDIIILSDPEYRNFFMNAYRGKGLFVTLSYPPGEMYSPEHVPQIVTDDPDERLGDISITLLDYAADHYHTIWLVENLSRFHPWAYRPAEFYLVQHDYPVATFDPDSTARLIRFAPIDAPPADDITDRDIYHFGESILLTGYDFPETVVAGEVLPVSLRWEVNGTVNFDYNVGVFLVDDSGRQVATRNSPPQDLFGYTSRWLPDNPIVDNHGLAIPADLPAGIYALQVVMYDWRDVVRLPVIFQGERMEDDFALPGIVQVVHP